MKLTSFQGREPSAGEWEVLKLEKILVSNERKMFQGSVQGTTLHLVAMTFFSQTLKHKVRKYVTFSDVQLYD